MIQNSVAIYQQGWGAQGPNRHEMQKNGPTSHTTLEYLLNIYVGEKSLSLELYI